MTPVNEINTSYQFMWVGNEGEGCRKARMMPIPNNTTSPTIVPPTCLPAPLNKQWAIRGHTRQQKWCGLNQNEKNTFSNKKFKNKIHWGPREKIEKMKRFQLFPMLGQLEFQTFQIPNSKFQNMTLLFFLEKPNIIIHSNFWTHT